MPEYACKSKECDGRIFESKPNTARCIYCGGEEIRRIDRPWLRPLIRYFFVIAVLSSFLWLQRDSLNNMRWSACKIERACNYDALALFNDAEKCTFGTMHRDCNGNCLQDADGDGVCDPEEIYGCMDSKACNFDSIVTESGKICIYATGCDYCSGPTDGSGKIIDGDSDNNGVCDVNEVYGCTDREAYNFNDWATKDDGSCRYFPAEEIYGCKDPEACNYDSMATESGKNCIYARGCDYCSGTTDGSGKIIDGDNDNDGVCDIDEIYGCTDREALNFNDLATQDNGSCRYFSSGTDQKCKRETYYGNIYEVVEVNGECWFAENLRTRKLNDGSTLGFYDSKKRKPQVKATEMGLVYNYYAISTYRLCPVGWTVPTLEDWNSALKGGQSKDALKKLKLNPFYTYNLAGDELRRNEYWLPYSDGLFEAESIFIFNSNNYSNRRFEQRNKNEMLGVRCKKSN